MNSVVGCLVSWLWMRGCLESVGVREHEHISGAIGMVGSNQDLVECFLGQPIYENIKGLHAGGLKCQQNCLRKVRFPIEQRGRGSSIREKIEEAPFWVGSNEAEVGERWQEIRDSY